MILVSFAMQIAMHGFEDNKLKSVMHRLFLLFRSDVLYIISCSRGLYLRLPAAMSRPRHKHFEKVFGTPHSRQNNLTSSPRSIKFTLSRKHLATYAGWWAQELM